MNRDHIPPRWLVRMRETQARNVRLQEMKDDLELEKRIDDFCESKRREYESQRQARRKMFPWFRLSDSDKVAV